MTTILASRAPASPLLRGAPSNTRKMAWVDAQTVGRRIKAARALAGLDTQEELGKLIGYSASEVGRWERGEQTPRLIVLNAIAEACGLDREWFANNHSP